MSRQEIYQEVEFGTQMCRKLHKLYFNNIKWEKKISNAVARLFSDVKREAKIFFSNSSHLEMLEQISKYNDHDFKEMCELLKINQ